MATVGEEITVALQNVIDAQRSAVKTLITPVYNVVGYGAKGDGTTDDAAAIQAAINAAAADNGTVYIPQGNYKYTTTLNVPKNVAVKGAGMFSTILKPSGAINGIECISSGVGGSERQGELADFSLAGDGTGLAGITLQYRQEILLRRLHVSGFTRQGIYLNYTIMTNMQDILVGGCGGASYAQVEVDNSTTIRLMGVYISGGNAGTVAGLRVDRGGPIIMIGGAIESTGALIQLASKSESVAGVTGGMFAGVDLENPTGSYVEAGLGWTGSASNAVRFIEFVGCVLTPSGATDIDYGFRLKDTYNLRIAQCTVTLVGTPVAAISLDGTGNRRLELGINSTSDPYLLLNGSQRLDAKASRPWFQEGQTLILASHAILTQNSATPSCDGQSWLYTNNSAPTTITNLTGGVHGQFLIIQCGDGNTTIANTAGGAGEFYLRGGVNLTLQNLRTYTFICYNGVWMQIN